jgi:hypothetical protein
MKKGRILAILVAVLLVVGAGVYTYARYTYSITGNGEVDVARWAVAIKQGGSEVSDNFNLGLILSNNNYVVNGKIAPNRDATATLSVDLTGTEVATDIQVDLGSVSGLPTGMTISGVTANGNAMIASGNIYSTTIDLNAEKTAISTNTVTLVITVTWANDEANNANDTTFGEANASISIPVTVTVRQHVGI